MSNDDTHYTLVYVMVSRSVFSTALYQRYILNISLVQINTGYSDDGFSLSVSSLRVVVGTAVKYEALQSATFISVTRT